jgi:hypothetical protein
MKIRKMELYKEVADRLNRKGIKPFSAREFSMPLVQQVVYGKVRNDDVMFEIKEYMLELLYEGNYYSDSKNKEIINEFNEFSKKKLNVTR